MHTLEGTSSCGKQTGQYASHLKVFLFFFVNECLFSLKTMESLEIGLLSQYGAAPLLPPANEVWEGYIFTSVCLSTGGGLPHCILVYTPQQDTPGQAPPLGRHPPRTGTPWADTPLGSAYWDTVNKRAVGIPPECNLVYNENSIASVIGVNGPQELLDSP